MLHLVRFFSLTSQFIREFEANFKLNGTHKLMVYANVNMLSGGTRTKNKNTRALLVTTEKIKYMVMFRHQHVLQNTLKSGAIQIF